MAETCKMCFLVHAPAEIEHDYGTGVTHSPDPRACVDAQAVAMHFLLRKAGRKATCDGCGKTIYFIRHTNGSNTPYTEAGLNHFVDCVARDRFKRAK